MCYYRADRLMRELLNEFGFCSLRSLHVSLWRVENTKILGVFSGLGVAAENLFGLKLYSLLVFFIVILVELVIGIIAGVKRTKRFRVHKLERFGLKFVIYFFLLLVLTAFMGQYAGRPEYYVYSALHSFLVFYIIGVYSISILENTSYLLGGSKEINDLLKVFRIRLKKVTDDMIGSEVNKENKENSTNTGNNGQ